MTKNTNATSTVNGWNFQVNAAILLFLRKVKEVEKIRVEGKTEDIELYMHDSTKIFAQAKSFSKPWENTSALRKLKDALSTLNYVSNNEEYEELIYVSNSPNPLKTTDFSIFFSGEQSYYSISELSINHKNRITKILEDFSNGKYKGGKVDTSNFDLSKLSIYYFAFYGEDERTKYKVIYTEIREFLNRIDVDRISIQKLSNYWLGSLFKNASDEQLKKTVSKKEMIWPIIVLKCEVHDTQDIFFDEYSSYQAEEVLRRYWELIDYQSEKISLVINILSEFTNFQKNTKTRGREAVNEFIENKSFDFEELITEGLTFDDPEIKAILTKLVMDRVINQKYLVDKIRKEVNLNDY